MPHHIQLKQLVNLLLLWIFKYTQELNFIPQLVFEILWVKESCNLIGPEVFGPKLKNQIFPRYVVFGES